MREFAPVKKITWVKSSKMLLLVGMSMKTQTKIQNQLNILVNNLIMFFSGEFWYLHLWIFEKGET